MKNYAVTCVVISALLSMLESVSMMRSMRTMAHCMRPMTPLLVRRLHAVSTQPDYTRRHWPNGLSYTGEQKRAMIALTIKQLHEKYPINNSDHPIRDERKLKAFINSVAKDICPGPEEYRVGHLADSCPTCAPARRGTLPEVMAVFRKTTQLP